MNEGNATEQTCLPDSPSVADAMTIFLGVFLATGTLAISGMIMFRTRNRPIVRMKHPLVFCGQCVSGIVLVWLQMLATETIPLAHPTWATCVTITALTYGVGFAAWTSTTTLWLVCHIAAAQRNPRSRFYNAVWIPMGLFTSWAIFAASEGGFSETGCIDSPCLVNGKARATLMVMVFVTLALMVMLIIASSALNHALVVNRAAVVCLATAAVVSFALSYVLYLRGFRSDTERDANDKIYSIATSLMVTAFCLAESLDTIIQVERGKHVSLMLQSVQGILDARRGTVARSAEPHAVLITVETHLVPPPDTGSRTSATQRTTRGVTPRSTGNRVVLTAATIDRRPVSARWAPPRASLSRTLSGLRSPDPATGPTAGVSVGMGMGMGVGGDGDDGDGGGDDGKQRRHSTPVFCIDDMEALQEEEGGDIDNVVIDFGSVTETGDYVVEAARPEAVARVNSGKYPLLAPVHGVVTTEMITSVMETSTGMLNLLCLPGVKALFSAVVKSTTAFSQRERERAMAAIDCVCIIMDWKLNTRHRFHDKLEDMSGDDEEDMQYTVSRADAIKTLFINVGLRSLVCDRGEAPPSLWRRIVVAASTNLGLEMPLPPLPVLVCSSQALTPTPRLAGLCATARRLPAQEDHSPCYAPALKVRDTSGTQSIIAIRMSDPVTHRAHECTTPVFETAFRAATVALETTQLTYARLLDDIKTRTEVLAVTEKLQLGVPAQRRVVVVDPKGLAAEALTEEFLGRGATLEQGVGIGTGIEVKDGPAAKARASEVGAGHAAITQEYDAEDLTEMRCRLEATVPWRIHLFDEHLRVVAEHLFLTTWCPLVLDHPSTRTSVHLEAFNTVDDLAYLFT